jgi:hypothetical protein
MAGRALHYTTKFRARRARNWYGDGSDGDIRITAAGAEQSFDSGVTWAAVPGWTLVGSTVSIPSVQDGDMVVVNARTLAIDAGYTLTVANRCRGLLIYCKGDATINGTISMTARGCRANPASAGVGTHTPVAPSDGHAVPADGIVIRRFAAGQTATHTTADLMHGCGQAAVDAEANQPEVNGDGVVVAIPRLGGIGAAYSATGQIQVPPTTAVNGTGGGGGWGRLSSSNGAIPADPDLDGGNGTCFSGGAGGGFVREGDACLASLMFASDYGGQGGDSSYISAAANLAGGVGNPGGRGSLSGGPCFAGPQGPSGTGGIMALLVCGNLTIGADGILSANGVSNTANLCGASGGGVVIAMYAGSLSNVGTITATGGLSGSGGNFCDAAAGSVVGPLQIDPA